MSIPPEKPWAEEVRFSSITSSLHLTTVCSVSLTPWLPDLQSIFVSALHRYDPLSQWKTHLDLITWARLLPLSYFLSLKRYFLSFTPSLFSFALSLSFSLCSLVSALLVLQLPDHSSPAPARTHTCTHKHTRRTSNTLVWPRGHRYTGTKAFGCCIVISSGSAIG